jgi:hypothetical protein
VKLFSNVSHIDHATKPEGRSFPRLGDASVPKNLEAEMSKTVRRERDSWDYLEEEDGSGLIYAAANYRAAYEEQRRREAVLWERRKTAAATRPNP